MRVAVARRVAQRKLVPCRFFLGRAKLGEQMVTEAELRGICESCVEIFLAALGSPAAPSDAAAPPPAQGAPAASHTRWGAVLSVFQARFLADGRCYLDSAADAFEAESGQGTSSHASAPPMAQPDLYFAMDWPSPETRWRQLETTCVWPGLKGALAKVGHGAPHTF